MLFANNLGWKHVTSVYSHPLAPFLKVGEGEQELFSQSRRGGEADSLQN